MREAHTTILHLDGDNYPAQWAEDGRTCSLDINLELYDGDRLAYISAICREDDVSVRVDLDRAGWEALAKAVREVMARFDASDAEKASDPGMN